MHYPEPLMTIDNVEHLLDVLVGSYDNPIYGEAEFQGDIIGLGGIDAYDRLIEIYPWHKDPKIIFIISKGGPFADNFTLCISKGGMIDQLPGCLLPSEYQKEVEYTIRGLL